jgi:hypothetical protein
MIFWGLLLVSLSVAQNEPGLLAGLGYVLLARGAGGLAPLSRWFGRAAALSWAALAWMLATPWLFDVVMTRHPIIGEDQTLYLAVRALIDVFLVWTLFGGIGEYAACHNCPDLSARAWRRGVAYAVFPLGVLLVRSADPLPAIFVVPAIIFVLAWALWIVMALFLVHRVRTRLAVRDEATRKDARRPWQFSLRTLLLAPVVLWLLLLACFPKLLTGDFCNVRIDKLSVSEGGQVEIVCSTRTSSGTTEVSEFLPSGGSSISDSGCFAPWPCRGGFPAWPCHGGFGHDSRFYSDGAPLTTGEIRARLLVQQGKTYRVVPGKPLYFYDFKDRKGERHCSYIKVVPHNRLGL